MVLLAGAERYRAADFGGADTRSLDQGDSLDGDWWLGRQAFSKMFEGKLR